LVPSWYRARAERDERPGSFRKEPGSAPFVQLRAIRRAEPRRRRRAAEAADRLCLRAERRPRDGVVREVPPARRPAGKKRIGPAWEARGRPPAGHYTRRLAEAWLEDVLARARRGTLPGLIRTDVTFGEACDEYLHWLDEYRQRKPSTLRDYRGIIRTHLLPAFATMAVEDITPERVEQWAARLGGDRPIGNRTKTKIMTVLFGVMERARKSTGCRQPAPRPREAGSAPARRHSRVRAGRGARARPRRRVPAGRRDLPTAAFTGLRRGELVALRWRDVDFARSHVRVRTSYADGVLTSPKSGRIRAVPMAPDVASALARLGRRLLGADRVCGAVRCGGHNGPGLAAGGLTSRRAMTSVRASALTGFRERRQRAAPIRAQRHVAPLLSRESDGALYPSRPSAGWRVDGTAVTRSQEGGKSGRFRAGIGRRRAAPSGEDHLAARVPVGLQLDENWGERAADVGRACSVMRFRR
jgi:integrase